VIALPDIHGLDGRPLRQAREPVVVAFEDVAGVAGDQAREGGDALPLVVDGIPVVGIQREAEHARERQRDDADEGVEIALQRKDAPILHRDLPRLAAGPECITNCL
jgi:hypothetical protein